MEDTWGLSVFSDGFFKLAVIVSDYSHMILIKRDPPPKEQNIQIMPKCISVSVVYIRDKK